jgi:hypothetical protein
MATRLQGWEAIAFAERNGCSVSVHAVQGEEARDGVAVEEARRIAGAWPERIYVDFDEPALPGRVGSQLG